MNLFHNFAHKCSLHRKSNNKFLFPGYSKHAAFASSSKSLEFSTGMLITTFLLFLFLFYGYISFDMSIIICHYKYDRRDLLWDSLYCRHSDQTWQPVKNISMKKWNNEHIWILSNSLGRYINGTIVGVV